MFTPENELEDALARAASELSALRSFYRHLVESNLILLGSMGERLAIESVKTATGIFHPVFTSITRLDAFGARAMPHFEIKGRTLFDHTKGAQFVVNPRSPLAKFLTPEEVAWILENVREVRLNVAKPKSHPTSLVKALCVLFTSRSQINTARLGEVARGGVPNEPHLAIAIEAEGGIVRLAEEIFKAAELALPRQPIELVHLRKQGTEDELQRRLRRIPPFFRRAPGASGTLET